MQPAGGKSYVAHQLYRTAIQQEYAVRTRSAQHRGAKPQKQLPNRPLTLLSTYVEKYPTCFSAGKINIIEKGIEEIDVLPSQYRGISTLFLSNNRISDLAGVTQFPRLRSLSLAYNDIVDISQLEYLSALPNLRTLRLDGNGIARQNDYRIRVIAACTSLHSLDGQDIAEAEREEAAKLVVGGFDATSKSRQADCVVEIAQKFSPKSLREKLRAAQQLQGDQLPNDLQSHIESTTQVGDRPLSNASLVRDMTTLPGDQPSTILRSLHEADRDGKDIFERTTGSAPHSIELFPNKMNMRTFSELTEVDTQSMHSGYRTDPISLNQLHKQKEQTKSAFTEGKSDPLISLTQASTATYNQIAESRRKRSASIGLHKQINNSVNTSFQAQKNPGYVSDLSNTGMIIGDLDVHLSSDQSTRSPAHTINRYSLSSPQELQFIITEQAKELSLLRAKYSNANHKQQSFSSEGDMNESNGDYSTTARKQAARLEQFATLFTKLIKRATLATFVQNCRAQIKLRKLENHAHAWHRSFLLSKSFTIIHKISQDCFKSMLLETAILPQQRLRNIFITWKAYVSELNARKSQCVTRRGFSKAIEYHETQILQRIALTSLCAESERRASERSQCYARWLELHGPPRTDILSLRGVLNLWRERLSYIRCAENAVRLGTRKRLIYRAWAPLLRYIRRADKVKTMVALKNRVIIRIAFSALVHKYLRMRQIKIMIQLLVNRFTSILRTRAFHAWKSQTPLRIMHPAIQAFIESHFSRVDALAARTLLKRSFRVWRYSSDSSTAILLTSLQSDRNKDLALLAIGSMRSALYLRTRDTLAKATNGDNELSQAHVQKLKGKISVLSKELNANITAQHALRDKVTQLESRCNDLLHAQQAQEDTLVSKDKRIIVLEQELEAVRNIDHLHVEAEFTDIALLRVELKSLTEKYANLQTDHHALLGQNRRLQADIQARDTTIQEQLEANRLLREGIMQAQQFKSDMIAKTARTEAQLLATRAQLSAVDQAATLDRADHQAAVEESMRLTEEAKAEVQVLKEDIQYYKGLDFAQRTKIMSLEMQKEELAQRETRMQEQIMDLAYSASHPSGADTLQGGSRSLAIGDFSSQSGIAATIKPVINYMRTKNEPSPVIKRPSIDPNSIDLEIEELQNKIADKFFQS
ncbi:U2 small nuclear ribonucleoprotein A', putative [Giardia lamblia P15]|uniref:U2 small nuclear ribonucleoprotein A', putative n=1 Tax=Giardia intestinalis (strain P15) TaxID=658858 RepID=E1F9B3_GIAIA|nr:U2 small nuclear ribonucleoprotein A', putative [Giardia lamblia P15]